MTTDGEHLHGPPRFAASLRDLAPQVLASLTRRFGDFAAAEDAVQEALMAAALQWPERGVPEHPRAWLMQVATRRLTDALRADAARRRREASAAEAAALEEPLAPAPDEAAPPDDTLLLLFMCCHASLTPPSAIALTLRAVGGLTTLEIAKAFLVPEATMAQRIARAKETIRDAGARFAMPDASERAARLEAVLHVLYLMFNEGYAASGGDSVTRPDLSDEAMRLARAVAQRLPEDPEAAGLLALMLLTDARKAARTGEDGELVPLDEQDRARWDGAMIAEGTALVSAALQRGAVGPYQLQAAIAALHDEAARVADTDWAQILALYGLLMRMSENPMVKLNHAVALAMVHGPRAGLERLLELAEDPRLSEHHRLFAVRGHLEEQAGEPAAAIASYRAAARRTASIPERNYLLMKAARLA